MSPAAFRSPLAPLLMGCLLVSGIVSAEYKEEIGYTRLVEEFGDSLPDGAGISVAQIEFIRDETWAPEARGELSGVQFTYSPAITGAFSPHANLVGRYFYGRESLVPGVTEVYALRNSGWYANIDLTRNLPPRKNPWRVENHSWVGTTGLDEIDLQVTARLDYRVIDQGVFATVGLDNTTRQMWPLLANSYNSMVVGVASGRHNRGGSTLFTAERSKPDLVGPLRHTSRNAPVAAAAATLLIARAEQLDESTDAAHPPVIKALLMAGATKEAFPDWSNSPTRPLDSTYGAGNLNIYHSYQILEAGRHIPREHGQPGIAGWDWSKTPAPGTSTLYFLRIPEEQEGELSVVLAWNAEPRPVQRDSGQPDWTRYDVHLDKLALRLWATNDENTPDRELAASISTIDNVQHIYLTDLAAGTYALEVSSSAADVPYGLAWRTLLRPATQKIAAEVSVNSGSAIVSDSKDSPNQRPSLRRHGSR